MYVGELAEYLLETSKNVDVSVSSVGLSTLGLTVTFFFSTFFYLKGNLILLSTPLPYFYITELSGSGRANKKEILNAEVFEIMNFASQV
jgi:hypothetical protein